MELREYLKIIGRRIWILILIVIIITLAAYLITIKQSTKYSGLISTYVLVTDNIDVNNKEDFFKYNNYYALQTSSLFADMISAWIKDPVNVVEIYQNAGVEIPTVDLKKYSRLFSIKKSQPSTLQIVFESTSKDDVNKLLESAKIFVKNKTKDWTDRGLIKNVVLDTTNPIIIAQPLQATTNTIVGLAIGIVFGFALIFFSEYMSRKS